MKVWRYFQILKKDLTINQPVVSDRPTGRLFLLFKISTMKSKGLRDTIEKITQATGIKALTQAVNKTTGKDCGCNKRKEFLNKKFPYKK